MVAKRHKITNVTKVIVPWKQNYVPQFLKQRDINSYKQIYIPQKQILSFEEELCKPKMDSYTKIDTD